MLHFQASRSFSGFANEALAGNESRSMAIFISAPITAFAHNQYCHNQQQSQRTPFPLAQF